MMPDGRIPPDPRGAHAADPADAGGGVSREPSLVTRLAWLSVALVCGFLVVAVSAAVLSLLGLGD